MATYYVSKTGSNTAPYDTPAKAALLPETVVALGNVTTGPHTVYISAGGYASGLVFTDSDWANSSIICVKEFVFLTPAAKGDVVINPGGTAYPIRASASNISVQDITFKTSGTTGQLIFSTSGGAGLTLRRVHAIDAPGQIINAAGSITMDDCSFLGASANTACAFGSAATIRNSIIMPSGGKPCGNYAAVRNEGAGTVSILNCIIGGAAGDAEGTIAQVGAGITNIKNSIVLSGFEGNYVIHRTNGAINLYNNVLVGGWKSTHRLFNGTISTDESNIKDAAPAYVRPQRSGFAVVSIDDIYTDPDARFAYVAAVEEELASRGMKATWFIEAASVDAYAEELKEIISRGVITIGCHSYSHSRMAEATTDTSVYQITKVGATIDIDRVGNQITVSPGGAVSGFKSKTLAQIKTELQALGCTVGTINVALRDVLIGEAISDSDGAKESPCTPSLLIDDTGASGFYWVETAYAKDVMEEALDVDIKAFATPGGQTNANIEASIKNAGFMTARHSSGDYANGTDLRSINLYKCQFYTSEGFVKGATDAETSRNAKWIGVEVSHGGRVIDLLAHNVSELSVVEWGLMLDGLASGGCVVADWNTVANTITDSGGGWATADGATYTRSWPELQDYKLLPTSPCIGAGVDVGLTTDADGHAVPGAVGYDIGPYSYMPGWTPFDSTLPALALSPTAPGKLRSVQAWSKEDVTKQDIEKVAK